MSKRGSDIIGPLVLIGAGVVLLLNTMSVLPWTIWSDALRYWPVLLIIWGVSIALGAGASGFSGMVLIAIIAVVVMALGEVNPPGLGTDWGGRPETKESIVSYEEYQPSLVEADLTFRSGSVFISNGSEEVLKADARYYRSDDEPALRVAKRADSLKVDYGTPRTGSSFSVGRITTQPEYRVYLGRPEIPTRLNMSLVSGKLDAFLDDHALRSMDIRITSGDLKMGYAGRNPVADMALGFTVTSGNMSLSGLGYAGVRRITGRVVSGDAYIHLGGAQATGTIDADLNISSGRLRVIVPEGVGIKVSTRISSGNLYVEGRHYTRGSSGNTEYVSRDYDSASLRVHIKGRISSGNMTIERAR